MNIFYLATMITAFPQVHYAQPVILADSLDAYYSPISFIALDDGSLLFVDSDERICSIDMSDPTAVEVFSWDWVPGTPEWNGNTNTYLQGLSPNGSLICFTQQVMFPESLQVYDTSIPGPVIVVVCGTDGSNARIVCLSFDIGHGPSFSFTSDSRYLYGGMTLGCLPDPEGFAAYVLREDDSGVLGGYLIDAETGERIGDERDCVANDGYYCNPWSDLAATGGFPHSMIVDAVTQEILLVDSTPGSNGIIDRWVLPDAALAEREGTQVLLCSDGREIENPGPWITVHSALSDGRYICSMDDGSGFIYLGSIEWNTFQITDAVILAGLEDYEIRSSKILETADGAWLIFIDGRTLYSYELP